MAADIKVQRGTATIAVSTSTLTLTAGVDYTAPSAASKAFVRIVSSQNTATSTTTGSRAADTSAASVDDSAITTQIVFTRTSVNASHASRVDWELVEYIGADGGPHEFVVRGRGQAAIAGYGVSVTTGAISGIVTDADVLPWVQGVRATAGASTDTREVSVTAAWNGAGDTVTFTRANLSDGTNIAISYAVIEWTGSAWSVQVVERGITAAGNETRGGSMMSAQRSRRSRLRLVLRTGIPPELMRRLHADVQKALARCPKCATSCWPLAGSPRARGRRRCAPRFCGPRFHPP
jgi:hypothetical protein